MGSEEHGVLKGVVKEELLVPLTNFARVNVCLAIQESMWRDRALIGQTISCSRYTLQVRIAYTTAHHYSSAASPNAAAPASTWQPRPALHTSILPHQGRHASPSQR